MNEQLIRILIVEDNPGDARLLQEMLSADKEEQFQIAHVTTLSKAIEYLSKESIELVLLDLGLPDSFGLDTFAKVHLKRPELPIIILTGLDDKKIALKTVSKGAQDYLVKGQLDSKVLHNSIRYSIERKKAEESLRESESRFRSVFDNTVVGMALVDKEGIIFAANQSECNFSGYSQKEIIGKPFSEITCSEDVSTDKDLFNSLVNSTLNGYSIDKKYKRKDGTIVWGHQNVSVIRDSSGKLMYTVIVCEDITERKKSEAERKRIENKIQQSHKMESLGMLASGIAHDFNNLLIGLSGFIELALEYTSKDAKARLYLEKAMSVLDRASDLSEQLLIFSKGSAPIKRITNIASSLQENIQSAIKNSMIKTVFHFPEDLWLCAIDENQMRRVFENIIINACQAMLSGGIITITAENIPSGTLLPASLIPGDHIRISIHDQGTGIPKENLPLIFDPFFTTKPNGNGLGLSTAYSIIRRHDGYIGVESELSQGTTIYIYLPAMPLSIITQQAFSAEHQKLSKRILVMDDKDYVREVCSEMLQKLGYSVECAKDGQEAIELYKKAKEASCGFDALILDITIPGKMGGKEALSHLVQIDPDIKAIASSGYSEDSVMLNPTKFGFAGKLSKPYKIAGIAELLESVLEKSYKQ